MRFGTKIVARSHRYALAMLAVVSASSAMAQAPAAPSDGIDWSAGMPAFRAFDGDFTLRPLLRIDADAGAFSGQDEPDGFRSGVNLRRGRLGLRGTVLRDISYNFTWDFGGSSPNDYNNIYEAQMAYTGLGWATLRAGAFTPQHLPEYAGSSFDLLFMERAAITNIAGSIASGDTRVAVGLEAHGDRWVGSFYGTDGVLSTRNDDRQRGLVGRAAALLVDDPIVQLQLGINGAFQFEPGTSPGRNSASFADYPELRIDSRRFLNTRSIPADHSYAWGPELAGRAGPAYVEALYQRVGVDALSGGARNFDGWYLQAALPLIGPSRERDKTTGTWARPKPAASFDPREGHWGALELTGRYSTADLRDGPTRGGQQSIWTVGLNWFPASSLRLSAQYENGRIGLNGPDRDFQAVGLRASLSL